MAQPDLNWTLENAPDEAELEAGPEPGAPRPPRRPRPRWLKREHIWRWLVLLGFLGFLIAAGAAVAVRWGDERVRAQITAEVLYEDAQSRTGDVDLALSVWADAFEGPNGATIRAWRRQRAFEIGQGLAAPLPAAMLTPTDGEPQVTAVEADPNDPSIWVATVVRGYRDPDGHTLAFALPQRYHNLGPGLWERVPPDTAALADTTIVSGFRFSATVPVDDLPWLTESLFATDAALMRACGGWGPGACGAAQLQLVFASQPDQLPGVPPAALGQAAGYGPYPWAFDLAPLVPRYPQPLVLPAPHVAGLPQDQAARDALTHALTVYGLTVMANVQTGPSDVFVDYFRDALVARAELRLGLTPPPTYTVQARDYVSIEQLWQVSATSYPPAPAIALPLRLQVLEFLDTVLAGRPPTDDAALLDMLHHRPSVKVWLATPLGNGQGTAAVNDWQARVAAEFAAAGTPSLAELDGLDYRCGGQEQLLLDGFVHAMPDGANNFAYGYPTLLLSPDGGYLAAVDVSSAGQGVLSVYRMGAPGSDATVLHTVSVAPEIYLMGWSAADALVYMARDEASDADAPFGASYQLLRYDLPTDSLRVLAAGGVPPWLNDPAAWLPDRRSLVVNLIYPDLTEIDGPAASAPALVTVDGDPTGSPRRLADQGFPTAPSPNGQWVAYGVPGAGGPAGADDSSVEVLSLATGERHVVLSLDDLRAALPRPEDWQYLLPAGWSGDSAWLLLVAGGNNGDQRLLMLPADGSAGPVVLDSPAANLNGLVQVDHSADGRYLSYRSYASESLTPVSVIDLEQVRQFGLTPSTPQTVALEMQATAWSPTGHRLAVASPTGLRLIDLDTGLTHWVTYGVCDTVRWYALPPSQ